MLGRYEIQTPLGAGGMGEVYRAKDLQLGREVAIKILPSHLSSNPDARRRFEQEARTISVLNDPNICTLHDVGHQDGVDFLVMELLEGETLENRLRKGPLPLEQVCKYGAQIASGLDKAHRRGILHRDLKPGNVMLTKSGAKLLDFGLAKATQPVANNTTVSATLSTTDQKTLVGTFPYMSPEQVKGESLETRSDIFSLGAVLYEMVTGRRAFDGKSYLSVVSAILEKEPQPITTIAPSFPPDATHLISRCLAKDPEQRWQTARDVASELQWIGDRGTQSSSLQGQANRIGAWLLWLACGVLLGAALLAATLAWRSQNSTRQESYFLAAVALTVHNPAFAPNGHTVAAVGFSETARTNDLWLYEVGSQQPRELADTQEASFPFWSPDGKSLGFFADGKLKRLEIAGGPVQLICDAPLARGGTWNKDGVILFTPSGHMSGGLYRVSAAGGVPTHVTTPDASRTVSSQRWPIFLPDGKHFLYLAANLSGQTDSDALYAGSLDSTETRFITRATGNAAYAAPGYLLFAREKTLYAQTFDAASLTLSGEAIPLLRNVSYLPRIAHNDYAVSNGDVLVAQPASRVSLSRLVWRDRKGEESGTVGKPDVYANVRLAPNGKAVAFDKTDQENQNTDLWTFDLQQASLKRLTFDPAIDAEPLWSPDGKRILFASSRAGVMRVYVKNADGGEDEQSLPLDASDRADQYPTSWSPDGKHFLYERNSEATRLWIAEMPDLKTWPLLKGSETTRNGEFSPDGKWIAYNSNETGKWEIYVTSFPDLHGKWQVSNNGGTQPRWRGNGKELFYLAPDGNMMATPLTTTGDHFDSGTPVALFQAKARQVIAGSERVSYDVTHDGRRFLINTQMENLEAKPMMIILNWSAVLQK
jgi:eukaryotic-like serine/threonine-protein kinase